MNNKTLFVGCGGSGIKTLIRVNELLAGNPEMRQRIREDVSYLVIDTEMAKVKDFENAIKSQMGLAGAPAMALVQMTNGLVNLNDLVKPNFDEQKDPAAQELLRKHWWCAPDAEGRPGKGDPFRAIAIHNITEGAGQCSPISFLSAWNYLPQLDQDVTRLLEEIQRRNTDVPKPLDHLKVYIVTGMAGGTGRGCWNLVAFKIRQCLRSFGVQTEPAGVFFDATCFQSIWAGAPGEKNSMRMNSLTGFSELSAWMRLPTEGTFRYTLPDLAHPDTKGRTDVLHVDEGDPTGQMPVSSSYLIFGNNGNARLKDNAQYHEMAAAALYSLVAADTFIGPIDVNQPENVRSFAATTFEVETVQIRRYMELLVHWDYSRRLFEGNDETGREADAFAGNWNGKPDKDSFFGKTGFVVPEAVTADSLGTGAEAGKRLLARLMKKAETQFGYGADGDQEKGGKEQFAGWKAIADALAKQKAEEAETEVENVFGEIAGGAGKTLIASCEKMLAADELKFDEASMVRTLRDTVRSAFYQEGKTDPDSGERSEDLKPSVARARKVVSILRNAFLASAANVAGSESAPLEIQVCDTSVTDAEGCMEVFKNRMEAKADRKMADMFRKFGKEEIESLSDDFESCYRVALFFLFQKYLKGKFERAGKILKGLDNALATLEKALGDVAKDFERQLCVKFGVGTADEAFDELFTRDDSEAIFGALPEEDLYTNVYRRTLKPITSPEELAAKIAEPGVNAKPLVDRLQKELENLIGGDGVYSTPEDARSAIRKAFVGLVSGNVGLPMVNGKDFMSANFSFMEVLEHNRRKWNQLLRERWNSEDARGKLTDRFRVYLGVKPESLEHDGDGQGAGRIPQDILLPSIVGSMALTCRPWMQLKGGASMKYLKTIALVPKALDMKGNEASEFETIVKDICGRRDETVQIFHRGDRTNGGNRLPEDRIVLFAATGIIPPASAGACNPFDFIESLHYWSDAELTDLLDKAEKQAGIKEGKRTEDAYFEPVESPYKGGWKERTRTFGLVSPIFLTEPQLNYFRWRPWKPQHEDTDVADQRRAEAKEALLFALTGTGVGAEVRAAVEAKGWGGFPLLAMKGAGKGAEALVFQRKSTKDALAWKEGETLGTTLETALAYLEGEGRPGETRTDKQEEQRKQGNAVRKALLEEKEAFGRVLGAIAEEHRQAIRAALDRYLEEQAASPKRSSRELWEELYRDWHGQSEG